MNRFDRRKSEDSFEGYVATFDITNPQIALKYEHSIRVAELCEKIARADSASFDNIELAWLCGLLHDIGRFEQLHIWGTFRDSESMDHADLGRLILEGKDPYCKVSGDSVPLLSRFTNNTEWMPIIKSAVGLHNKLCLPPDLDDRTRMLCDMLRDADKIDIVRVFSQQSCDSIFGIDFAEFAHGTISDKAMGRFYERRCLGPQDRETDLDRLLGVVCLAFEIVNDSAFEVLTELGYMNDLLQHPFGVNARFAKDDTQRKWDEVSNAMRLLARE